LSWQGNDDAFSFAASLEISDCSRQKLSGQDWHLCAGLVVFSVSSLVANVAGMGVLRVQECLVDDENIYRGRGDKVHPQRSVHYNLIYIHASID
jgi:hypothetical protein